MSQKSYNGTPTLYLIATPIGNMKDITFRAIEILKEVEVIFSEDARVTGQLLKHFDIKKSLISNDHYKEKKNILKLEEYLKNGHNVGLVTDRGTPIVSDPGYELVKYAIEQEYNVVAIPGATALIPALITSGITTEPFTFFGFLNSKETKRKKELEKIKKMKTTLIFYEAPHRILDTLNNILEILGNRNIAVCREITKKYEEIYRGKVTDVIKEIIDIKGEIVIVVEKDNTPVSYDISIIEHINLYIKEGMNSKEAIKQVAIDRGIPKSIVYNEYHGG